jgi:hypothetical protein
MGAPRRERRERYFASLCTLARLEIELEELIARGAAEPEPEAWKLYRFLYGAPSGGKEIR